MPFPAGEHVVYEKNPLENVICQVRFPTILKIDTEPPSIFQERVKKDYVDLTESQAVLFDIKMGGKPIVPLDDLGEMPPLNTKTYEFATEDKEWKAVLTRNYLGLSNSKYENWPEFRGRFETLLGVLIDVYKPVTFVRVGLRYIDVIVRSKLSLDETDWTELINENILGMQGSEFKDYVREYQSIFVINLKDNSSAVRVRAGTIKAAGSGETCFMVDSDYYNDQKTKPEEIMGKLDLFHSKAFNLFKWCITDKLHYAMEPKREGRIR